ncbi:MAG: hypothetical protein QM796_18795 [Chthoniobacteraceae bacterium]
MPINPKSAAAAARARDKALQTPDEVRAAFLGKAIEFNGIRIGPLVLGVLYLLEEVGSPFARTEAAEGTQGKSPRITQRDLFRAIAIFHDPELAREVWVEHGEGAFDKHAFSLASKIHAASLPAVVAAIGERFQESASTAPGGGANPQQPG